MILFRLVFQSLTTGEYASISRFFLFYLVFYVFILIIDLRFNIYFYFCFHGFKINIRSGGKYHHHIFDIIIQI